MTQIYNLIILDESGSMSYLTDQTISGCNETIQTIKSTQEQMGNSQQNYVSIYAFQSGRPSRYIFKNVPASAAMEIGRKDYQPYGGTPLLDAVGSCLADMKATIGDRSDAIGSITIITDGEENSSTRYTLGQVARMISEFKERGWNFNFIGANIDVIKTAAAFNIDNHMEFSADAEGTKKMWEKERRAKMAFNERMRKVEEDCLFGHIDEEERLRRLKEASKNYYDED